MTRTQQLDAVIASSGISVTPYATPRDGIVAFTVDGYEGLPKIRLRRMHFDLTEYEATVLEDQMQIHAVNPVYRLITNEKWSVIVPLDEATAGDLAAEGSVQHPCAGR